MISLYQSVTNLTFLDAFWFKPGTGDDQGYIPIHVLASELELPICCLLPAMHAGCNLVSIRKMTTFQTLKNKIDKMTNMINFGDFPHSLWSDCMSCRVTWIQSESTLCSCLNVKELLARSRREISRLSDCNWTRTQNHLVVLKRRLNRWAKLVSLAKWLSVRLRTKWFLGSSPVAVSLVRLLLLQFSMCTIFKKKINQVQVWLNCDIECLPKRI